MKVYFSPKFERSYKKLDYPIQLKAREKTRLFILNYKDPKLKTHMLVGENKGLWSFSVDYKNRVLFEFASEDIVYFLDIGSHDIYK